MITGTPCAVCGDPVSEDASRICNNCERPFHLRLVEGDDAKDCGEVWINERYLSLEFACNTCLGNGPGSVGVEPPVGTGH